jgi:hypothetical protein
VARERETFHRLFYAIQDFALSPGSDASRAREVFVASYRDFLGEVETLNSYISDSASRGS